MDKELQQLIPDVETQTTCVDLLVKVWLNDGSESWLLLHVEVQNQQRPNFSVRVYDYHHDLRKLFRCAVCSLAVLGDTSVAWRPNSYREETLGCSNEFIFPMCKLLDFRGQESVLLASTNPFALFILAHLRTQDTKGNAEERLANKFQLVRELLGRGYEISVVRELFRVIDAIVRLPQTFRPEFVRQVKELPQMQATPFITPTEEYFKEQGNMEKLQSCIVKLLKKKFPGVVDLAVPIDNTTDIAKLDAIYDATIDENVLETWRKRVEKILAQPVAEQ